MVPWTVGHFISLPIPVYSSQLKKSTCRFLAAPVSEMTANSSPRTDAHKSGGSSVLTAESGYSKANSKHVYACTGQIYSRRRGCRKRPHLAAKKVVVISGETS